MSRIHYWSDLHLGHEFVAGLRGFTPAGDMDAWEMHDLHIQEVWMAHVKPKDHIWILGDISGGRNEDYALDFIGSMPGTKHLIAGNHDSVHPMHRNAWKKQEKFLKVFASVQTMARHKVAKKNVLLSHFPAVGDHADRLDRYVEYRPRGTSKMHIVCGHVHDTWKTSVTGTQTYQLNVGVDQFFDRPANTEDIIEWLNYEGVR